MNIKITKTNSPKPHPDPSVLGFGKYFTDHMFTMDYAADKGWFNPEIIPFGKFLMHPASTVFHYGAEVFEGMKAYRRQDGKIQLFRPLENAKRMNLSAQRLCLPTVPEEDFIKILNALISLDEAWTPSAAGTSLYLRPFLFGNDESLGVHPVQNARFMLIASPVGSYYKEGLNPVRILVEDQDVRAVKGGTGYTKCGGNYAASLRAGKRAQDEGYAQALWLDGIERKYIEEVGAMNVMFKIKGQIITPELSGSVLPGITRMSCIELLQQKGYTVSQRKISIDELISALENGSLEEAWGTGTAAVVASIGTLGYKGKQYTVGGGKIGKTTQELYDTLTGIQWGTLPDTFKWTQLIK